MECVDHQWQPAAGTGLIFNDLYVGRIVWNKVRMVKNPDTGKRISRPNTRDQWQTIETPHLRIVDDQTWEQVRRLKAERANLKTHMKRRPPHLLSGLLRCGCCGSGMSVHDLFARRRGGCVERHARRTEGPAFDRSLRS
jgi:hypothetical protein